MPDGIRCINITTEQQGMRQKKPKDEREDASTIKPISAAERRRLDQRIKKKHEKLRRRYPEVHGKKVDWISHWHEDGLCFFDVRFTDGRNFSITCHPIILTDVIDFSDMKTGDQEIIHEYYRRT